MQPIRNTQSGYQPQVINTMKTQHPQTDKINLKGLTLFELEELVTQWDQPKYRAKQLMSWMYQPTGGNIQGNDELARYKLRQKLADIAYISGVRVLARTASNADTWQSNICLNSLMAAKSKAS